MSRGGFKLEAALSRFDLSAEGVRAVDIGSSTGGFTDCLLQRGAERVVAIDVGTHQLHERIRADPRVVVMEQTDVRSVEAAAIDGPSPLVVVDLSFISVRTVAEKIVALVAAPGDLIVLVKPQFEAGKAEADRGRGVIRDPEVWRGALVVAATAIRDAGAAIVEVMVSPIRGGSGNVEFLVHAVVTDPPTRPDVSIEEMSAIVVDDVGAH